MERNRNTVDEGTRLHEGESRSWAADSAGQRRIDGLTVDVAVDDWRETMCRSGGWAECLIEMLEWTVV